MRAVRFDAVANPRVEIRDLQAREPVARVVFAGELVLAARGFELVVIFEVLGALEMPSRGDEHRALKRDLVVGIVGRRLHGRAVVSDGLIVVPALDGRIALTQRVARGTACRKERYQ